MTYVRVSADGYEVRARFSGEGLTPHLEQWADDIAAAHVRHVAESPWWKRLWYRVRPPAFDFPPLHLPPNVTVTELGVYRVNPLAPQERRD